MFPTGFDSVMHEGVYTPIPVTARVGSNTESEQDHTAFLLGILSIPSRARHHSFQLAITDQSTGPAQFVGQRSGIYPISNEKRPSVPVSRH